MMDSLSIILLASVLWLAYSNGANDNFKGVATIYGSGTANFRKAIRWATVTTVAGSLASVYVASELAEKFKGRDWVPVELMSTPELAIAAGAAAAATILLATLMGIPTSTTHALVGGLLGSVLCATGTINGAGAMKSFFVPLLVSPVLGGGGAMLAYPLFRFLKNASRVKRQTCICLSSGVFEPIELLPNGSAMLLGGSGKIFKIGDEETCVERYDGVVIGVNAQTLVDTTHYLSGGAVCFARGMNDTPKIAALLLATQTSLTLSTAALVTLFVAAGGLLQARRVAETMSRGITDLNAGQGLTANLVTSGLVLFASSAGLPVSTTHVSCASIFGIGLASGKLQWRVVGQIGAAWLTTLPLGAALGALFYWGLR